MNYMYLLQGSTAAPGFGGFQFIFLGLMILVFWLFFIRPQAKRAKNQKTFDFENDAFYCSELIHFSFKAANGGSDLFHPKPMTYKDPDTGELFPIWETYFLELGIPIPEGKPGLNPGGMSLEPVLEMMEIQDN